MSVFIDVGIFIGNLLSAATRIIRKMGLKPRPSRATVLL